MRKKTKRRIKLAGMILGVLAAAFLCFAGFFYVSDIHVAVVGSTRYTDQEIREMVFQNFADRNSLYLAFVKKSLDPGQAFIKSITVEYESHNSLRLHVNEDAPVGFIRQDTFDYYFDSEGVVLEALPSGTQSGGTGTESTESVGTAASSTSGTDTSGALQAVTERGSDTQFRPALADVVEVTGLTEEPLKAGQTISVTDSGIFSTLQAVTRLFNKFGIKPDSISVDSGNNITLHYGTVDVCLGKDILLEEKMARVDAILPQLKGLSGTLHLENYSEDTINIIFDQAGEDSSDSAEGKRNGQQLRRHYRYRNRQYVRYRCRKYRCRGYRNAGHVFGRRRYLRYGFAGNRHFRNRGRPVWNRYLRRRDGRLWNGYLWK